MSVRFLPAGDLAVLVELDELVSADLSTRVRALEFLITESRLWGVIETVPAFRSLLVYYDPRTVSYKTLCHSIAELLPHAVCAVLPPSRRIVLPCCYEDPTLGIDLAAVADRLCLSKTELVKLHSEVNYLVYFIGFAPGEPYLFGMPERLTIPRLETPRTKTAAGSVGIGGTQCCVYSVESPGGFWVLGRTPVQIYDPVASDPILLRPGDRVRFRPVDQHEYDAIAAEVAANVYQVAIT